jgi:uncharacterized protein (DUF849 family)
VDRKLIKPPFFIQTVFGLLGGIGTHSDDVMHMKRTADRLFGKNYEWSVLGAGANQMRIGSLALASGGNVRVGLEDSIWAGKGVHAKENADQVIIIKNIAEGMGLDIASPNETREILKLKGRDKICFT